MWQYVLELRVLCGMRLTQSHSVQHTPFQNILPNLHIIYNNVILMNVLTEV